MRAGARAAVLGVAVAWPLGVPLRAQVWPVAGGEAGALALRLKTGRVDTARLPDLRRTKARGGTGPGTSERLVVQLDGPVTRARRAALEGVGVTLEDYLPDHAYIARADAAALARLNGMAYVAWVGALRPEWKLDATIGARDYETPERRALKDAGLAQVVITLFEGEDAAPVLGAIGAAGGRAFDAHASGRRLLIDAVVRPANAVKIAALPGVQFVEDAPEGQTRFDSYRWVVQSNVPNFTPLWNRGLHGEGQIAGVIDSTVNITHCAFADAFFPVGPAHRKIVAQHDPQAYDSHGTHVAGIIAGDHDTLGAYDANDGIAFAARLSLSSTGNLFSSPSGLYDHLQGAHDDGARVHSNSFGDNSTNAYTSWCAQVDQFTWDHEDDLVVFAINNGSAIKSPENALNALAVGAGQDSPFQGSFCFGGTGPTIDGRRKPDVYAPGCNILSANYTTECSYFAQSGTSMACPAVAGSAVLVRQYFTDGYYPTGVATPANAFTPSGALLRAVMVNSAVDMAGIFGYPSNVEGWGRILLDNTLYFPGDQRKLLVQDVHNAAGLGTTETSTYTVTILSSSTPLTITLAFTHPPAAVNALDPVANDLNLEVVEPGGATYRGNLFASGQSTPGVTTDPRNTVEQFLRTSPAPGVYQITVRAAAVNVDTQGYALAISGDIDLCLPPVVPDPPQSQTIPPGNPVTFSAVAYGSGTLTYQWKKDLVDIPGATAPDFTIPVVYLADAGEYSVTVTGACGTATTLGADLIVPCVADYDHDGFVTGVDFDSFVEMFVLGDEAADIDNNGFVNGDDFDTFIAVFAAGC